MFRERNWFYNRKVMLRIKERVDVKKKGMIVGLIMAVVFNLQVVSASSEKNIDIGIIIDNIKTQNQQLNLYDTKIEIQQKKLRATEDDILFWKDKKEDEKTSVEAKIQNDKVNQLNVKVETHTLKKLEFDRSQLEKTLCLEAQQKYYNLYIMREKEMYLKDKMKQLELESDLLKKKVEFGLESKIKKIDLDIQTKETEIAIKQLESKKKAIKLELEDMVNGSIGEYLDLKSSIESEKRKFEAQDIEQLSEKFAKSQADVFWKKEELKIEELRYNILYKYRNFDSVKLEYLKSEQAMENLKYEIESNELNAKYNLSIEYRNVVKAYNEYELQLKKLELQEKNLNNLKLKKELGFISELDYQKQELAYRGEKNVLLEKHLEYIYLEKKFKNKLT